LPEAGSIINFAIWIGHEEDKHRLGRITSRPRASSPRASGEHTDPNRIRQAWEEIYIAEGSDWFWWFGDDHSSAQDDVFDYLFPQAFAKCISDTGRRPATGIVPAHQPAGQAAIHTLLALFSMSKLTTADVLEWVAPAAIPVRTSAVPWPW